METSTVTPINQSIPQIPVKKEENGCASQMNGNDDGKASFNYFQNFFAKMPYPFYMNQMMMNFPYAQGAQQQLSSSNSGSNGPSSNSQPGNTGNANGMGGSPSGDATPQPASQQGPHPQQQFNGFPNPFFFQANPNFMYHMMPLNFSSLMSGAKNIGFNGVSPNGNITKKKQPNPGMELSGFTGSPNYNIKEKGSAGQMKEPEFEDLILKDELKKMIEFLMENVGFIKNQEIIQQMSQKLYKNNKLFLAFEGLMTKFSSTKKTKEEIIKFVLRKAFKFLKSKFKTSFSVNEKEAWLKFIDHYFKSEKKEDPDFDFESFVLPFKKNSPIKTMNQEYLKKLFSYSVLVKDYIEYLENFDQIVVVENSKKIDTMTNKVLKLIKGSAFDKIKRIRRLPWLKSWLEDTKKIAFALIDYCNDDEVKGMFNLKFEGDPLRKKIKVKELIGDSAVHEKLEENKSEDIKSNSSTLKKESPSTISKNENVPENISDQRRNSGLDEMARTLTKFQSAQKEEEKKNVKKEHENETKEKPVKKQRRMSM